MLPVKRFSKESRRYTLDDLNQVTRLVQNRELTISKAATEFSIPRKTLDDHVKNRVKNVQPGQSLQLLPEEELPLVNYIKYMSQRGFPMTRNITRQFIITIIKKTQRETRFNLDKGPSDKWFRHFFIRHPELSQREPEIQDRARQRMSNEKVMKQYFSLLNDTVQNLKLTPAQIFNCDETGWSGKEKSKVKVIGVKGNHNYQQAVTSTGHITAHLCIGGDGRILPTFVIFEKSLPHIAYKDRVPDDWMFGFSESGYMDSELFHNWFERVFIPNCGSKRPVLLIMDNHDSHINLDVIDLAKANQIELMGLPPHTTHILQPLDVYINGPLKAKFSSTAVSMGHLNKYQTINKAKFPVVLSDSIDQLCSPARIKEAFRRTGIVPLNPDAIDKSQLVPSHSTNNDNSSTTTIDHVSTPEPVPSTSATNDTNTPNTTSSTEICSTCGTFLGGNPLVKEGLIPQHLSDILQAVPAKPLVTRRKLVTEARVLTSLEFSTKLREKAENEQKKKEEIAERKRKREENRVQKEKDKEAKKVKKGKTKKSVQHKKKTKATEHYICDICSLADPENDDGDTNWIECEICDRWYHPECVGILETEMDDVEFRCEKCLQTEEE